MTRILAAGCFHGKMPRGFEAFVWKNNIDIVFALGDFPGENVRLLLMKNSGKVKRKGTYFDDNSFRKLVGRNTVRKLEKRDMKEYVSVLKRLNSIGKPVYLIHGNNDFTDKDPWFKGNRKNMLENHVRDLENIVYLDYESVKLGHYDCILFGAKYPNFAETDKPTTKRKKIRVRKEERTRLLSLIRNPRTTIVFTHQPPYKTKLDRVNNKKNPGHGMHFGDDVLRSVIERKQPALVVCAHFHENQGFDRIGRTRVACTGYGAKGQAAIIDLKKKSNVRLVKI